MIFNNVQNLNATILAIQARITSLEENILLGYIYTQIFSPILNKDFYLSDYFQLFPAFLLSFKKASKPFGI